MRASRTRRLEMFVVLLAAYGCAGPAPKHEYTLTPGQSYSPRHAKAFVVPINETSEVPADLEFAGVRLEGLLDDYLRSKGISIRRPDKHDYRRAARVAAKRVRRRAMSGESGTASSDIRYADIVPALLEELASDDEIAIVPNVVMRTGSARGGKSYKWDGVRRYETGYVRIEMSGDFPVASFYVAIYNKGGTPIFSGYGGLDTVFEISVDAGIMVIRDDLFENDRYLKEGICVAFYPYFGEDERC